MDMDKHKRTGNVSVDQKKEIIEFMEKHPALKSGKFTNDFTFKKAQLLWEELENKLNSLPGGAKKDWKQWRKTWQDMKGSAKKKNGLIKKHMRDTGGGPPIRTSLTDEEIKLIEIMGTVAIEGDPKVLESNCEFSFVNCDESDIIIDHDYITQIDTEKVETPEISSNISAELDISQEGIDNCTIVNTTLLPNKNDKTPDNSVKDTNTYKTASNFTFTNTSGKKPVRVQRLDNALSANNKLVELSESQVNQREKYYSAKLKLYERDVIAKEKIAVALENIVILLTKKNSVD